MSPKEEKGQSILESLNLEGSTDNIQANNELGITKEFVRNNYTDQTKMRAFKSQAFESGDEIKDVFSQKTLTEKQAVSKELYGDQWANHSAEADHITPVKELHDKYNKNPFLKDDDLKDVANKDTNFSLKSKSSNASKRDSTNQEWIENKEKSGVKVDKSVKKELLLEQKESEAIINSSIVGKTFQTVGSEALAGMGEALTASAIPLALITLSNFVKVIDGDKEAKDAVIDISRSVGVVAGAGAASKLLRDAIKDSGNKALKTMFESNFPVLIVSSTLYIKDDVIALSNHEISKETATANILSKFVGLSGGAAVRNAALNAGFSITSSVTLGSSAAVGAGAATGVGAAAASGTTASTFLASAIPAGAAALAGTAAAIYLETCAQNLFDEVVGHGAWERIKNSSEDCNTMANYLLSSVKKIQNDDRIIFEDIKDMVSMQCKINSNLDEVNKILNS